MWECGNVRRREERKVNGWEDMDMDMDVEGWGRSGSEL